MIEKIFEKYKANINSGDNLKLFEKEVMSLLAFGFDDGRLGVDVNTQEIIFADINFMEFCPLIPLFVDEIKPGDDYFLVNVYEELLGMCKYIGPQETHIDENHFVHLGWICKPNLVVYKTEFTVYLR